MFLILLLLLAVAAAAHTVVGKERTLTRGARLFLIYLLVGYCGIPMVLVGIWCIARPGEAAASFGFPPGGEFQTFFAVAYLGMSIISLLAPFLRRSYLVGPAVCWAVFFAGATAIHFGHENVHGGLTHGSMLAIFATHGLISVLLLASLLASRAWRDA
jgi:hypothetical protein